MELSSAEDRERQRLAGILHDELQQMLAETLDRVMDVFHAKVAENGVELLVDVDPRIPMVLVGDPLRFKQILTNLLSNAVKFTARPGQHLLVYGRLRAVPRCSTAGFRTAAVDAGASRHGGG